MFNSEYPATRLRRMRNNYFSRRLVAETSLSVEQLISPLFICEGDKVEPIPAMAGVQRLGGDKLIKHVHELVDLGIKSVLLFPVVANDKKSLDGSEAYNPNGLVQKTIKTLKSNFPELGVITDVALDPYTSSGQDGVIDKSGHVLNDKTNEILVYQALSHVRAGADIVAPSDMMDGRIGLIRKELERQGFPDSGILAYSAKYASNFYGPFRDAVGSSKALQGADKSTYQMDFCNVEEALREVALDIAEGADMVMVKPGLPYLDVVWRIKDTFKVPTVVYQVSAEYAMLKSLIAVGSLDEKKAVFETLIAMRRAGANAIVTYFAKDVAKWLKSDVV